MMKETKRRTFFPPALTPRWCAMQCTGIFCPGRLDFSAGANDIGYGANVSGAVSDKLCTTTWAAARCYPSRRGAVICNVTRGTTWRLEQ